MSEDTQDRGQPAEYAGIRPTPHYLMLLLRSAVVDDGRGGPWLGVCRNEVSGGLPLYTHHIHTHHPDVFPFAYSDRRAVMLSGDEALAFAAEHEWRSLTDPTAADLRALARYAVEAEQLDQWAESPADWMTGHPARAAERHERRENARAAARGLRWMLAEQWLRTPAE